MSVPRSSKGLARCAATSDPDNVAEAVAGTTAELASNAARSNVALASAQRLSSAMLKKSEAEVMLVAAVADARATLRSELEAAADREDERKRSSDILAAAEARKRLRAETERELMNALMAVVGLTPEAEIATRLSAVADAKAEIIAIDVALADELGAVVAVLEAAGAAAAQDTSELATALASLPDDDADLATVRAYEWDRVEAAIVLAQNSGERAVRATQMAQNLQSATSNSLALRRRAVDGVSGSPSPSTAAVAAVVVVKKEEVPGFKIAAKEAVSAGRDAATSLASKASSLLREKALATK